jgi:hypothetical protein
VDETGQAGSPDEAGAYRGRGGYPDAHTNGATPTDDALEAIVTAWREPATGAIAGRAVVNGVNGSVNGLNGSAGTRGRAEVRNPYSDTLAPMSPPVSAPPPAQPPTSTLHYGHYGPDGQGWPSSTQPVEPMQALPPATPPAGTVYGNGGLTPDNSGDIRRPAPQRPVSPAPQYDAAPHYDGQQHYDGQAHNGQSYEGQPQYGPQQHYEGQQPHNGQQFDAAPQYDYDQYDQPQFDKPQYEQPQYEQAPSALDRVAGQQDQAAAQQQYTDKGYVEPPRDNWGYQDQQQRQWGPPYEQPQAPAQPEFDWAAPSQQLPTQRVPEDDPLVGPLPPELLGSGTALAAAEPAMPSFADEMAPPAAYEPLALPQRVPSEPDVPLVLPDIEPQVGPAAAPDLARIATYLREDEDDEPSPDGRPDGFDIPAVLRAVQGVSGVREATLRKNPDGLHTLRLELLDEADPGRVSRAVARLLNERMGLAAEPNVPTGTPMLPMGPRPPARGNPPQSAPHAAPHSALPGYGREARRRRPVSGVRRPAETAETAEATETTQPPTPLAPPAPPALVPHSGAISSPRVVIDSVDVNTQGIDAMVEVRLVADGHPALGVASGPNFDGYMLRLPAFAAASAVDQLLVDVDAPARAQCYIQHAEVVPMGGCDVAVVVLLLKYDGYVEQLTGSAVVSADPAQAVVRATMAAVNRRLEALLP